MNLSARVCEFLIGRIETVSRVIFFLRDVGAACSSSARVLVSYSYYVVSLRGS
jgi:hypothetical protein